MSLPKIVVIYEAKENNGTKYLIASASATEAMDGTDGPRVVGTYRIFNRRTLVKQLKATKEVRVR